jgi:hypothetical protein
MGPPLGDYVVAFALPEISRTPPVSKTRYGPSSMLMKMTRGAGRLPYYMSGYNSVLLEGQMKPWAEGQPEADVESLGPGSY